jgi:hypothetical protein
MRRWHDVELASEEVEDDVMKATESESEVVVADKEQTPRGSGARPSYFRSPQVLRVLSEGSRSGPCLAPGLSQITFWRWKGTSRDEEPS